MANLQFEDFCQKVCQMLRWKAARGPVSAELTAHLEDHAAALEARGLSPEEATAHAVTAMGNPYALGHALDQTHPPTLPRLSRLFLAVGLLALFLGILLGLNRDSGLFALDGGNFAPAARAFVARSVCPRDRERMAAALRPEWFTAAIMALSKSAELVRQV